MREILFRGKARYGGYWVEGVYINDCYILPKTDLDRISVGGMILNEVIKVLPETVGQFTGILSKHGIKIFDGDILQGDDDVEDDVFHVARIGQSNENRYECFLDFNGDNKCWMPFISYFNRMEIIGNIHDNPEMLT